MRTGHASPTAPYRITLWAEDASANRSERGLTVTVDTRPAAIITTAGSGFVTPDGDRKADTLAAALVCRPGAHRECPHQGPCGRDRPVLVVLGQRHGRRDLGWPRCQGRDPARRPYTFRVDGRDKGGNRTIVDRPVLVDRTIRSVTWSDWLLRPAGRAAQPRRRSCSDERP